MGVPLESEILDLKRIRNEEEEEEEKLQLKRLNQQQSWNERLLDCGIGSPAQIEGENSNWFEDEQLEFGETCLRGQLHDGKRRWRRCCNGPSTLFWGLYMDFEILTALPILFVFGWALVNIIKIFSIKKMKLTMKIKFNPDYFLGSSNCFFFNLRQEYNFLHRNTHISFVFLIVRLSYKL